MLRSDYDCRTKNKMLGSWDHSMNMQTAAPPLHTQQPRRPSHRGADTRESSKHGSCLPLLRVRRPAQVIHL